MRELYPACNISCLRYDRTWHQMEYFCICHVVPVLTSAWFIWCLVLMANLCCKTELVVPCPTFQTIEEQMVSPSWGFAWQSLKRGCSWNILFCKCWAFFFFSQATLKNVQLITEQYWDFYCHLELTSRKVLRGSWKTDGLPTEIYLSSCFVFHQTSIPPPANGLVKGSYLLNAHLYF